MWDEQHTRCLNKNRLAFDPGWLSENGYQNFSWQTKRNDNTNLFNFENSRNNKVTHSSFYQNTSLYKIAQPAVEI